MMSRRELENFERHIDVTSALAREIIEMAKEIARLRIRMTDLEKGTGAAIANKVAHEVKQLQDDVQALRDDVEEMEKKILLENWEQNEGG